MGKRKKKMRKKPIECKHCGMKAKSQRQLYFHTSKSHSVTPSFDCKYKNIEHSHYSEIARKICKGEYNYSLTDK